MQPETPIPGETQVVTDPKTTPNPATSVATPTPSGVDPAEVERLRKEAEQATMRANQLANQLKAKEDAEAAAKAKELEEQNQYKDLYEQTQEKLREVEAAQAQAEKDAAIKAESDKLFAGYPDEVKQLAEKTGLRLTDTDELSVEAFKKKLDDITPLVSSGKVTPNNPGNPTPPVEQTNADIAAVMKDPMKFQEYLLKNSKGIASQIRPAAE